jgi:monoamine oxidase
MILPDNTVMPLPDFDVLIIGAGVAGLAALRELDRAGCSALCLEARDRIGGRIFTVRDSLSPLPIELGAEFIHGRPPEIWDMIHDAHLVAYDCTGQARHIKEGRVQPHDDAWQQIEDVMTGVKQMAATIPDEPFASFLNRSSYSEDAKQLSTSYVEGFNAARKEVVGIASLAQDATASDAIEGDRAFRLAAGGYQCVPLQILAGVSNSVSKLRLNAIVESIQWRPGSATVRLRSGEAIHGRGVVVTVPLGVLQAAPGDPGVIRFDPEPHEILGAARAMRFGQAVRVVLRFREAFWEADKDFADPSFLLSDEPVFPTWWTTLPVRAPILTGWSAGPCADALIGKSRIEVLSQAISSLARITSHRAADLDCLLQAAHFHDWQADPFARGAYSYVPAGALPWRAKFAEPVQDTLYFSGEATEQNGQSATVHGAIASGIRAARQVLERARL